MISNHKIQFFLFILLFISCESHMKNYNGNFTKKEIYEINKKKLLYGENIINNINKIKIKDTEPKIMMLLGKPSRIRENYDYSTTGIYVTKKQDKNKKYIGYTYFYYVKNEFKYYFLHFRNNILTKISKNF